MATIKVRMVAFCDPMQIREVDLPDDFQPKDTLEMLGKVFELGQNDFQPKPFPSVSVGDVIEYKDDLYMVCAIGFRKLEKSEYDAHVALPRSDRSFNGYKMRSNVR